MSGNEANFPVIKLQRFIRSISDGPFGSSLASDHYSHSGARVVRLGNIGNAEFRDADAAYISMSHFASLGRHEVLPGDLLIAGLGDQRHPVGRACVAPEYLGPALVKADCFRVRLDESRVTHRYAAWALSSSFVTERTATLGRGSTRTRINLDAAREVSIPVPSVEEQWRIVNFLDAETARLDLLHKARERQRAALLQRSQVELEEFMATEIKKYGKVALRRAAWRIEQGWSPQCDDHLAAPDEWGVLKTSAVSSGNFNAMAHKKLPSSMEPDIRYIVEDGDLLLTRGSGSAELVGMAAVAETGGRKLLLSDLLYRVSLNPQWSTKFVAFALRSPQARQQVLLAVRGASGLTVKIRTEDILGITVPATPGSMQREIARELNRRALEYSRLIEVISCSNELIAERRNALIAAAVTGQFEVTTGAGADLS